MKWNKRWLVQFLKYMGVFLLVIAIYQFFGFSINYGDPIANYGFSYGIARGQIPYLDFNTISTPLYAFYGAIGLLVWNNYLMFIITHAILVTIFFFFLNKLYGKKSYLILAILIGMGYFGILATYNFMCFTILTILLYLEEKHSSRDYLIGFFIGLAILSKQTVGCFFIIPTIIKYFKNPKKIGKRAIGCFIPCIIFLIYLITNGALFQFIDLCFLGLFDFSSSNGKTFTPLFNLSFLFLILAIYLTYLNPKDIKNYYLLSTFFFAVPLFDLVHISFFVAAIIMMMAPYLRWKDRYNIIIGGIIVGVSLFSSGIIMFSYHPVVSSSFHHFEYTKHYDSAYQRDLKVIEFLNRYEDAIILSVFTMQYDIINDKDLDYYDVMLYGNFGYDGVNKMINKIKNSNKQYVIVSTYDYKNENSDSQFAKKVADYVINHGHLVESKYDYDVYYME